MNAGTIWYLQREVAIAMNPDIDIEEIADDVFTQLCENATAKGIDTSVPREEIRKWFPNVAAGHLDLALYDLIENKHISKSDFAVDLGEKTRAPYYKVKLHSYDTYINS